MDPLQETGLRGTKRDASGAPVIQSRIPRRIQALDQDVVNKIAAGEIIVAPVHALKELLENAVDAGATQLEIIVKEGGLKLLQITDNGCGIHTDDLPLLCERFTTSKLQKFEDLTEIATYGFRGEALASISHIAHLAVTTKTTESSCAWKAYYMDGRLKSPKPNQSADPKPTAGRQGTQITVEDLFYNVPTRRRAFRSAADEYNKILDLIGRYSIHCTNVGFSCKKHGESGIGINVPVNATITDRIRQIHGNPVANEIVEFKASSDRWGYKASGWISNANYSVKKLVLILFINHRSVESPSIKKAFEQTYSNFLPKGGHPFIYLSLEIEPRRLDVNVHPTKREVHFLHEDEIVEELCTEARVTLGNVDTSRTFMTQTLLPNARIISSNNIGRAMTTPATPGRFTPFKPQTPMPNSDSRSTTGSTGKRPLRPYDNDLVRTDSRERKITSMLASAETGTNDSPASLLRRESTMLGGDDIVYETIDKEATPCRLRSIKELRTEVRDVMHNGLTDIFASHTFVGVVDSSRRVVAIQSGVKLFLIDYGMVANEYFYQVGLTDFGNFGSIKFEPPLDLAELLRIGADFEHSRTSSAEAEDIDWEDLVDRVRQRLIERRDMLSECFSICVTEDGSLTSIPLLVKGYMPAISKLPHFLIRLGPFVNWNDEKPCFRSFLRELANFYVPERLSAPPDSASQPIIDTDVTMTNTEGSSLDAVENPEIMKRRAHVQRALEFVLFPAFKTRLVATKGLLKGVVEIANLKGLYRVFERC